MRKLTGVVLVLALLWVGYWFIGARAVENGLRTWLDERAASGWDVSFDDLATRGMPNRFDTTVQGLAIFDPRTGYGWRAPFFQILALSYKPNHVIAVWPRDQTVETPGQSLSVTSAQMRASAVVTPGTALTLDRTTLLIDQLGVNSSAGWQLAAREVRVATRQGAGGADSYVLGIEVSDLALPAGLMARLEAGGSLPAEIETLHLDATLGLAAPLDRFVAERGFPAVISVELRDLSVRWGAMEMGASGALIVDARGLPEGQIDLSVRNWRQMLAAAQAAGLVTADQAARLVPALAALAAVSGNTDTVEVPLGLAGGNVSLGPVVLGPVPRLSR